MLVAAGQAIRLLAEGMELLPGALAPEWRT